MEDAYMTYKQAKRLAVRLAELTVRTGTQVYDPEGRLIPGTIVLEPQDGEEVGLAYIYGAWHVSWTAGDRWRVGEGWEWHPHYDADDTPDFDRLNLSIW